MSEKAKNKMLAEITKIDSLFGIESSSVSAVDAAKIQSRIQLDQASDTELRKNAYLHMIQLTHLIRCNRFYEIKALDFDQVPCLAEIAKLLAEYRKSATITDSLVEESSKALTLLCQMEKDIVNVASLVSYRMLRVFILCVIRGHYFNAGTIAELCLESMRVDLYV